LATSFQSSLTGCATPVAVLAGDTSEGADGVVEEAFTVNVAVRLTPPYAAEIVADVDAATELVVIVKLALVEPAGTVTLAGVLAALELSDSDTVAPPLGAAALNVTVPVDEFPPVIEAGLTDTAESEAAGADGFTVIVVDRNTLSSTAVIWALVVKLGNVVTGNVALVAPPGTVTLAGTDADFG
jgi:hypothetical protein